MVLLKAKTYLKGLFLQSNGRKRHFELKPGQTIDIPKEALDRNYKEEFFDFVDDKDREKIKSKEKKKKEPKTKDKKEFFKELQKISGIGPETAKDITNIYNKEDLINDIELGKHLPFRNDISKKLKEAYGGKNGNI